MTPLVRIKHWVRTIKRDVLAVYFAARDPRTPIFVRFFALLIAAYALSPIDLIPDAIPVLGLLDDALLVPLALIAIVRLIPEDVLRDARDRAETVIARPRSYVAAAFVITIWIAAAVATGYWLLYRY